jgi:hypothetical protein
LQNPEVAQPQVISNHTLAVNQDFLLSDQHSHSNPIGSRLLYGHDPSFCNPYVMVARSVRDWRKVSMDGNVGRGPVPTAEQDEGFSLLILACFISHPLIT